MAQYDLILQGGRYFDGSCAPSAIRSLAIKDGRLPWSAPSRSTRPWPGR